MDRRDIGDVPLLLKVGIVVLAVAAAMVAFTLSALGGDDASEPAPPAVSKVHESSS